MPTDRVALDIGLMTLTLQLTLNETFVVQALLNASERTELSLKLEFGQSPADAKFVVSAVNSIAAE